MNNILLKKIFLKTINLLVFVLCISVSYTLNAQITVSSSMTPLDLVQNVLLGSGVSVSNVTFTGCATCRGTFQGTSNIGMTDGVLLTTGDLSVAVGPNNIGSAGTMPGTPGDIDLAAIVNNNTFNATVLEFDFIPTADTIKFDYVFSSEEYPEYVPMQFNDVFAFFLTGQNPNGPLYYKTNIALLPGTTTPVTIHNVNNGSSNTGPCVNCAYYVNNTSGTTIQYDGFTTVLTAIAPVVKCTQYHIKIAIADVGDQGWDSGVFLKSHSFSSPGINLTAISSTGDSTMAEGCGAATFYFIRSGFLNDTTTICYQIAGTATNGTDYTDISGNLIDTCITFLPGQDTVSLAINPLWDGITESTETITIVIPQLISCDTVPVSASIYIINVDSMKITVTNDTALCEGDSKLLTVIPLDGIAPYTYDWDNGASAINTYNIANPSIGNHNYIIEVTDSCGNYASDTVNVVVNPIPTSAFTLPDRVCNVDDAQITYTGNAPSNATYTWTLGGGTLVSGSGQGPLMVNWPQPGIYEVTLTVSSYNCTSTLSTDSIDIFPCQLDIPNIITPNGDINNEYFVIKNLEYYLNPNLVIYNRWGKKIYESSNYQNDWDGENYSDGTYYYVLTLNDETSYHGIVTILR